MSTFVIKAEDLRSNAPYYTLPLPWRLKAIAASFHNGALYVTCVEK
jgi:hypothetical protein